MGLTVRYHDMGDYDISGITVAPSYKVSDNLLLVGEVRMEDFGGGGDVNMFALEALFTF
jgi:hypothetical protein